LKKYFIPVLLFVILASCTTVDIQTQASRSFTKAAWYSEKVAVFPALAAHSSTVGGLEADRIFAKELDKRYDGKGPKFISPAKVRAYVLDNKMVKTFERTLRRYETLQIIDYPRLAKIGTAMGVRYFLIPVLMRDTERPYGDGTDYKSTTEVMVVDITTQKKVFSSIVTGRSQGTLILKGRPARSYERAFRAALNELF